MSKFSSQSKTRQSSWGGEKRFFDTLSIDWKEDTAGSQTAYLPEKERRRVVRYSLSLAGILLVIVLTTSGCGAIFFAVSGLQHPQNLLVFCLFIANGGYILYALLRQFGKIRSSGWYGAKIKVTPHTLEWIPPSGKSLAGHWTDLRFVDPIKRLLYFSDGSTIRLSFGPDLLASISETDLDRIIGIGRSKLLADAFNAYKEANVETHSKWYPTSHYYELWRRVRSYIPSRRELKNLAKR